MGLAKLAKANFVLVKFLSECKVFNHGGLVWVLGLKIWSQLTIVLTKLPLYCSNISQCGGGSVDIVVERIHLIPKLQVIIKYTKNNYPPPTHTHTHTQLRYYFSSIRAPVACLAISSFFYFFFLINFIGNNAFLPYNGFSACYFLNHFWPF